MECIQPKMCNRLRDCQCDEGYSCCTEKTDKPTFGMCVKTGFCDEKRGIPMKNCKDGIKRNIKMSSSSEEYIKFSEGYNGDDSQTNDCNCNEWKHAMVTMILIVILLVFLGVVMYKKNN